MSLSITSTTSSALTAPAAGRQQQVPGHVRTAAEALGMSADDVVSALQSGKSLLDVADEQGISREDLLSALKTGAPADLQGSGNLDAVVEGLASTSGVGGPAGAPGPGGGGGGGHQGPPPPTGTTGVLSGTLTGAQQTTLDALSDLLGTDSSSLMTQLRSGSDLVDLLSQQGVGLDQLSARLEEGLLVDARA